MQELNTENRGRAVLAPSPMEKTRTVKNRALGTRIRANVSPPGPC